MNKMFNKSVIAVALLGTFAVSAAGTLDVSAVAGTIEAVDPATKSNDVVGTNSGEILIAKELIDNALDADAAEATRTLTPGEYAVVASRFLQYSSPVALKNKSTLVFKFVGGAVEANAALKLYTVAGGNITEVGALTDFVADADDNYTTAKFQLGADVALNAVMVVGSGPNGPLAGLVQPTYIVADGSLALTVSVPEVRDDNAQLLSAPVSGSETIATVTNNFKAIVVTKNSDKIDVTKARKYFTDSATDNVSEGTIKGDLTDANFTAANNNIVYPTATNFSIKVTGTQAAISKIEYVGGATTALTASTPAGSYSKSAVAALSELIGTARTVRATTKTGTAAVAIEEAAYPVALTLPATASTKAFTLLADTTILDWKLNAATATIPYMPVGAKGVDSDTQNVIYVTNKGSTIGNIYVDVWSEAGVKVLSAQNVGSTKANGITKIGSKIKELLDAAEVNSQKVTIKVAAEVPQKEFEVFSAFTVSGNRQIVINDSNVTSSRNVGL